MIATHTPEGFAVIWLHGLGADGRDMQGLAQALTHQQTAHHVFLDAPLRPVSINGGMTMRAWYDIAGLDLASPEDTIGIHHAVTIVQRAIAELQKQGYPHERIVLAGFSQGGALALYTALHTAEPLGGVVVLSAYLPLAQHCKPVLTQHTPIFFAYGEHDDVVLPAISAWSLQRLQQYGYTHITHKTYPVRHAVSAQELADLSQWFHHNLQGNAS